MVVFDGFDFLDVFDISYVFAAVGVSGVFVVFDVFDRTRKPVSVPYTGVYAWSKCSALIGQ